MMDFSPFVKNIKSGFGKEELKSFNAISRFDDLQLASSGSNDVEGYQVFTPEFIVKQMVEAVGDDVIDFSKTILEPTSGDGAFTTYILFRRLETIKSDFEVESLKALSTIYSIEMDKELIVKQRNNVYTLVCSYIEKHGMEVDSSYYDLLKCIIVKNFIWSMFNSDCPIGGILVEVAYKMPQAEKKDFKSIDFPVWKISNNEVSFHNEGVEA